MKAMGMIGTASLLVVHLGCAPLGAQETVAPGHGLGDPDAPVRVMEFADFACSACAEFAVETWPRVRSELVETGRVHWRIVPFSLGFRHGERAARASECAHDQGAFWAMHDRLFAERDRWMEPRRPEGEFEAMAGELGLDSRALRDCLDEDHPRERLRASREAARNARVRATPTFLVNGEPVLGALPYAVFLQVIRAAEDSTVVPTPSRAPPTGVRPSTEPEHQRE